MTGNQMIVAATLVSFMVGSTWAIYATTGTTRLLLSSLYVTVMAIAIRIVIPEAPHQLLKMATDAFGFLVRIG